MCFIILQCLSSYSPDYFCKCITANMILVDFSDREMIWNDYQWESSTACQRCCSYNIQPRTLCFNFIVQTLSWLIFTLTELIQNHKLLVIMNLNSITDTIAGNEQSWASLAPSDVFHSQLLWLQQWPSNHDRDYCFFKSVWLRAVSSFTRPGSNVCRPLHIKHTEPNDGNETMKRLSTKEITLVLWWTVERVSSIWHSNQLSVCFTLRTRLKTFYKNVLLMLPLSCLKCPVLKSFFIGYVNIPSLCKHYENVIFKCTLNILKQVVTFKKC